MGADLLSVVLVIESGKKPDWGAAAKFLTDMSEEDLIGEQASLAFDNYAPDDMPELAEMDAGEKKSYAKERRESALDSLETLKSAYSGWRNTTFYSANTVDIWIMAEMSWGDCPEGMDDIWLCEELGVTKAAGFEA